MRVDRRILLSAFASLALMASRPAAGQVPGAAGSGKQAPAKTAERDALGRDSPHDCVVSFLIAAERADYVRAVQFLEVRQLRDAPELAQQLQSVLNLEGVVAFESLSREPDGDLNDGLPPTRERVGSITNEAGKLDIVLHRVQPAGQPPFWLVSYETLQRVTEISDQIEDIGIEKYVPRNIREIRLFSFPVYRWIGVLLGVLLAIGLSAILTRALLPLIRLLIVRFANTPDFCHESILRGPLRLLFLACGMRILSLIAVTALARRVWNSSAITFAVIGFAWLLIRFSDIVAERVGRSLTQRQLTAKLAVVALSRRLFKVAVATAAALALLYASGRDITAILAGVGIGGIALALAAQKTLENLFGGISMITDEPIRVGDFCRVGDQAGTVEDIGLRSTRIRTLNRTVLSIPNGQLSVMTVENFTIRDRFLFKHKLTLRYETTPEQLQWILAEIRELFRTHPSADPNDARVRLIAFGDSAFEIEIFVYMICEDFAPFLELQEQLLFGIIDIVAAGGSGFAYPSQTLYMTRDKPADPGFVREAAARIRHRTAAPLA
jgi:MscS family membrane protein